MKTRRPTPGKSRRPEGTPRAPVPQSSPLPRSWNVFVDEVLPAYVKRRFSPKESWKSKPFSLQDGQFFLKSIRELSELFTDERPGDIPGYFRNPKFRSAYFLYFLPLQAAKFLTLFGIHPDAANAALEHGLAQGTLRVLDLGAGPGTASIALLLWLVDESQRRKLELPQIELEWFDTQSAVMEDGRELVAAMQERFPELAKRVKLRIHVAPWWEASAGTGSETSLVLIGNVLNETPGLFHLIDQEREHGEIARGETTSHRVIRALERIAGSAGGGGTLFVEPAFRRASQLLSRIRDHLLRSAAVPREAGSIWGPCLHAESCPLAVGRDWCHFSVRAEISGKWFKYFSRGLGSERQWVKFSYVWFSSREFPSRPASRELRRVVSDPLRLPSGSTAVLLCEPEVPYKYVLKRDQKLHRGDLVRIRSS